MLSARTQVYVDRKSTWRIFVVLHVNDPRPKVWSLREIKDDCDIARENFRVERIDEPRSLFEAEMRAWRDRIAFTTRKLSDFLHGRSSQSDLVDLLGSDDGITAIRYSAAPPISLDDLKILSGSTLSRTKLPKNAVEVEQVRSVLMATHDGFRFPWIADNRQPRDEELDRAILATLSMLSAQRVQTARRNDAKIQQEAAVKAHLRAAKYKIDPSTSPFDALDEGPEAGYFSNERKVCGSKSDVVARLRNKHLLLVECKVSNSAVNSFKRLNHESVNKATKWRQDIGASRTLPAAVLRGVFLPENVFAAQNSGLSIFWEHRLSDLGDFLDRVDEFVV